MLKMSMLRLRLLVGGLALILIAGLISDYLFKASSSSRQVLAWVRAEPIIGKRFGKLDGVVIAKLTNYRNQTTGSREREYVILIDGSVAAGRVTIVDGRPDSVHEYRIKQLEWHTKTP